MVSIVQNLVASNMSYYKVISESKGRTWEYITVHNTANDADAINEIRYMRSNKNFTSFHYAVDDVRVVQGLPDTVGAFDTKNHSFSAKGLSVEICYSKSGGSRFTQAEKNAAEFIAFKLKEMGYPCDSAHVKKHQDASGKYCPHRSLDLGWTRFMNLIQSYMKATTTVNNIKGEVDMTKEEAKRIAREAIEEYVKEHEAEKPSKYAIAYWNEAVALDVFDGTMPRSPLAREQAATVLGKLGLLDFGKRKDMPCPDWGKNAVQWAIDEGIISGDGKAAPTVDNVRPRDFITRVEAAVMLSNLVFNVLCGEAQDEPAGDPVS